MAHEYSGSDDSNRTTRASQRETSQDCNYEYLMWLQFILEYFIDIVVMRQQSVYISHMNCMVYRQTDKLLK